VKVSIILAHPHKGSFNHSIAHTAMKALARNEHEVTLHDLYQEGFDPILPHDEIPDHAPLPSDVTAHCSEIATAHGIVIIHPNWWGQPPAILKGWVDRILRPGVAYSFLEGDEGEGIPVGLLSARVGLVFNTSNTPQAREIGVFGDPLETLWRNCIFGLCGVTTVYRRMFGVIVTSTPRQRAEWLEEVEQSMDLHFPHD
jgi:NAD(P)H dehydrogenase (quinone)